nr:hypothetical protein [Tanacetum cinerariifolium]
MVSLRTTGTQSRDPSLLKCICIEACIRKILGLFWGVVMSGGLRLVEADGVAKDRIGVGVNDNGFPRCKEMVVKQRLVPAECITRKVECNHGKAAWWFDVVECKILIDLEYPINGVRVVECGKGELGDVCRGHDLVVYCGGEFGKGFSYGFQGFFNEWRITFGRHGGRSMKAPIDM